MDMILTAGSIADLLELTHVCDKLNRYLVTGSVHTIDSDFNLCRGCSNTGDADIDRAGIVRFTGDCYFVLVGDCCGT